MADVAPLNSFTGGELSPTLAGRVDLAKYSQGCSVLRNFIVHPHGGAVKRPGFVLLDEIPGEALLIPFVFNQSQAYCLVFLEGRLRVFTSAGVILGPDGETYEIDSPYTLAQARDLSFAQSADTLFLACWGVPPHRLTRLGHADWRFEEMDFTPPIAAPVIGTPEFVNGAVKSDGSLSPAQLTTPVSYRVSALDEGDRESELSGAATITGPSSNNWQGGDYVKLAWEAVEGASAYRVYKSEYYGKPGFIGSTTATDYMDHNIVASISEGAPRYEPPFGEGSHPGVVGLFEQRLVFGSTPDSPQTIWFSKSGDYGNFAVYEPMMDDSSIQLTVASSEMSSFAWLSALRSLIIGTASMEWEVSSTQGAFTAKTAKATPQSYIGSSKLPPILVGNSLLHVSRSGGVVRNLKYDFGSDSYGGSDLTILASHLFEGRRIVDWTYQRHPDSVIWCVTGDGGLFGLTYMEDHQVAAWHSHVTEGAVISVCSVPGDGRDPLFAAVRRGERHFVEIQAAGGVFLDCASVYEGPPVKTLSGLGHLEGVTVGVVADGAAHGDRVVEGGSITLDRPAARAVVGLRYTSALETMPIEVVNSQGTTQGRKKVVNAVNARLHGTVGGGVSVRGFPMVELKWRTAEPHGTAPAPFTGVKRAPVPAGGDVSVTVGFVHDAPFPANVLSLLPELAVN
jgi:hypothetical protein